MKLPAEYDERFSYSCAVDGCRKRHTPPSTRFLGRRVYLGAVVVLATALQQGVTPYRASKLRDLLGVSARTLARWRTWWAETFVETVFWRAAQGDFATPVVGPLPRALVDRFEGDDAERLAALLRFIEPLSTPEGYVPDQRR